MFFYKLLILITFLISQIVIGQENPPTNGRDICSNCVPPGWSKVNGTPDISNNKQATINSTAGGGALWVSAPGASTSSSYSLPLPPNNHETFICVRDISLRNREESLSTNIINLTAGNIYEISIYAMTATTDKTGKDSKYYGGTYADQYSYNLPNNGPTKSITLGVDAQNKWKTTKIRFVANRPTQELILLPGYNANSLNSLDFEPILLSISKNSINTVPIAKPDSITVFCTSKAILKNITLNDSDVDSTKSANRNNIDKKTIDLDPNTEGIQTTFLSINGSWTVSDDDVTFRSNTGFYGTEVINYTVQDNYILDGNYSRASSDPVTLTVNIVLPIKTYTLKDIYIRKNQANLELSLSGSQLGVNYQLQNNYDNTNIGDIVTGTGDIIKFPISATEGKYKVVASNPIYPNCNETLINTASVIIITKIDFHNSFTPNDDNINDFLKITGIEDYPNNTIVIFDRLGRKVYSVSGYDNNTIKFVGISNNIVSININKKLPTGVYYYLLDPGVVGNKIINGWIYLKR